MTESLTQAPLPNPKSPTPALPEGREENRNGPLRPQSWGKRGPHPGVFEIGCAFVVALLLGEEKGAALGFQSTRAPGRTENRES